jgi:Tol biopolymer transport system component
VARMDIDGTNRRRVTSQGSEFFPLAGADNRTVFYMTPTSGQSRSFKTSIDGGNPVTLADALFRAGDVSPDGRRLLGVTWDETNRRVTLGTLSVDGGAPELLNLPVLGGMAWTRDGKGVTYTDIVGGRLNLWIRDLASGTSRQLTNFTTDSVLAFAWSRDGSKLALVRGQNTSDVVMIAGK